MASAFRSAALRMFAVAGLCTAATSGWSQEWPGGQGSDAVVRVCAQCHPLTRLTKVELTADEWENALYDMIARGAPVHEDNLDTIRRYLIDHFATDKQ